MAKDNPSTPIHTRPTSIDVAKKAGVSRTQVSYVFSGKGFNHVSPEKRERIFAAAKELCYEPHLSAQALRAGYSNEFALYFPVPYSNFINQLLGTILESAPKIGCIVTQYSFQANLEPLRKQIPLRTLLSRRPVGIFTSLFDLEEKEIEMIQRSGIANILLLGIDMHPEITTLQLPVEEVGFIAANHFLALGHMNMAIINPCDPKKDYAFELKLRGMRRAMQQYPGSTIAVLYWPRVIHSQLPSVATTIVEQCINHPNHPTAVYAYNDDFAIPFMAECIDRGLRIPDDIAILGTDDSPLCDYLRPKLSSIAYDLDAIGNRAVAIISRMSHGKPIEESLLHAPTPRLIARNTT
jgi:LacI family transcriptional regulator